MLIYGTWTHTAALHSRCALKTSVFARFIIQITVFTFPQRWFIIIRFNMNYTTVKPVYKKHPRNQLNVALIRRWSLYVGLITLKVYPWKPVQCDLYKHVVFIYRWSLEQVWLYYTAARPCYCRYNFSPISYLPRYKPLQNGRVTFPLGRLSGPRDIPVPIVRCWRVLWHHGPEEEEKHDRTFSHGGKKDGNPSCVRVDDCKRVFIRIIPGESGGTVLLWSVISNTCIALPCC